MTKCEMDSVLFEELLAKIHQETASQEKKLEILYKSKGFFNAPQASSVIMAFCRPADKVRASQMMEPRLCRMTCTDARQIIDSVSISNDKLKILGSVKRSLIDAQTSTGQASLMCAFPFEEDKMKALNILYTVQSAVGHKVPAGGHQGYAALGGLYTQCRPLVPHLYGSYEDQMDKNPARVAVPPEAHPGVLPSYYTGHPSYAYPKDANGTYHQDRQLPGHEGFPLQQEENMPYPRGAPMLGQHQGAPAATGFPGLSYSQ